MDPNEALKEMKELANAILADDGEGNRVSPAEELEVFAERLAELTLTLNTWLCIGGALPNDWVSPRR